MKRLQSGIMLLVLFLFVGSQAFASSVTFKVNLKVQAKIKKFDPTKDTIVVRGDFNGWGGNGAKLTSPSNDSIYTGTFDVGTVPKRVTYKFVIAGSDGSSNWEIDFADGKHKDRTDTIPSSPWTLPVVWFNGDSVSQPQDNFMTFRVDMRAPMKAATFNKATDSVVVRGDFNGWFGNTVVCADADNDSIYTVTHNVGTVNRMEFKFVIHKSTGDTWGDGTGNIVWTKFTGTPQTLPIIKWNVSPYMNVTFLINTATDPDTIHGNSSVEVRGQTHVSSNPLDWSAKTTVKGVNVANGVAGATDYWKATGKFLISDTVDYKFFSNAKPGITPGSPNEHNGWEQDLATSTKNHFLVVGSSDTTLPVEFVNAGAKTNPQYWRPYVETDSVEVYFRVNMANNQDFNKAAMKMGVRGSAGGLDWGKTFFLKQEASHSNAGSKYDGTNFWSGAVKFPRNIAPDAGVSTTTVYYKFVIHNSSDAPDAPPVKWEDGIVRGLDTLAIENKASNPARIFRYSQTMSDTTLVWRYWANLTSMPPAGNDTVIVKFSTNLSKAVNTNSFKLGDSVLVRYGLAGSATASKDKYLVRQGITGYNYSAVDSSVTGTKIDATGKSNLIYQYYLVKNGVELRETYYNFDYTGTDQSLAERRMVAITSKSIVALDTSTNILNAHRQPFFRNTRKLTQVVNVTFKLDLRPAFWQVSAGDTLDDIQGPWRVTKSIKDSIYKWGVSINGPAVGGWTTWGNTLYNDLNRKMFDDGTHGDATAGDHIYAVQFTFGPDSTNGRNLVGQEFKFGIRGGDNEGGRGGYGNNHVENIDDSSPSSTIDVQWGSMNPKFYSNWDYVNRNPVTEVENPTAGVPLVYSLEQNYPNPFNPTTTISYSIPNNSFVTLRVFNILGQEVATVVNAQQQAGRYHVALDASSLASGVYLYRVEAGSFVAVKKMMLLK